MLTTVKEALDNSLDACEDAGILPDISVKVERIGVGSTKNTDKIKVVITDNGPGIDPDDIGKVFGEYLASSKFGRGRCSRGQQGIGISAATTYALQTTAKGVRVISKTPKNRKAVKCSVEIDLKNNKGLVRDKETIDWDRPHGTSVEFIIDGRVQLNGEAGLLNYLRGNILVNPHMKLHYNLPEVGENVIDRVSDEIPQIPESTEPHPHTMKLGEFIAHARLFGRIKTANWLKTGFSRITNPVIDEVVKTSKLPKAILEKGVESLPEAELKTLFTAIQNAKLMAPSTQSVLSVGEESLALSIQRLGSIDFFAVVTRKPIICDFKPVQVEVAMARLEEKGSVESEDPVQVLRFANRVPLQFDKAACAIVKAITNVNWRSYGFRQPKDSLPLGPYIIAVSVVSPFIKFKNASKETIDASDELVEEIRRALMQAGQRLSRHIKRENRAADHETKIAHIEQFGPILVEGLCRITNAPKERKLAAEEGLKKILGRDAKKSEAQLAEAEEKLDEHLEKKRKRLKTFRDEDESIAIQNEPEEDDDTSADGDSGDTEAESGRSDDDKSDEASEDNGETVKAGSSKKKKGKTPAKKTKKK